MSSNELINKTMPAAARIGDSHTCPASDPGPKAHVGGPIIASGVSNVTIGGKAAAKQTDKCTCVSPSVDTITGGSSTVTINSLPAARMGDSTAHQGKITSGFPKVTIGG